jgi:hypothetical protein
MAGSGDNILQLFITANVESLKSQMDAGVSSFKGGVESMKAAAASLPDAIETSVATAAATFISLNPALQAQAAAVLDLKAAYASAKSDIKETEDIIAEAGGTTEVTSSILRKYAEETAQVVVLQRALSDATKEYDRTLRELLNAQILSAEASKAEAAATSQATAAAATNEITDEARARVKAKLAELSAADAARSTSTAASQAAASRTTAAATEQEATAANTASEAYIRLANATVANAQAQAEVRAILSGAVEMTGLESQFTNELALAQEKAAATALELAAATKAVTVATEEASAAQSTFRGRIALSEYGVRGFISGMVTSVPVLVGIFATGFAIRAVEAIQKTELELQNLSILTGESVRDLYDLGQAAQAFGAKSDDLTGAMRRLDKVISDAASGNESARLTLRELGVQMTEINSGIVPKTSTVLAQMSDYLQLNAGNAEVMRAAMRALGSDSVALAAFLSQGSQKVREQSEQFALTGTAMEKSGGEARKLAQQQAELGATWDRMKLPLLELTNTLLPAFLKGLEAIGDAATLGLTHLPDLWDKVRAGIQLAVDSQNEFIHNLGLVTASKLGINAEGDTIDLKTVKAFQPPAPPVQAQVKDTKPKIPRAEASDLPEFREELAEREAAFEGSRSAMLAMELAFWENLISTGRVKARDLVAVHAEIARTEIQLRREVVHEAENESRDTIALTRAGSDARVDEAQRGMELERRLRGSDSSEFADAQKVYLLAVRDRVEETIRLQVQATEESVALESRGSAGRVALYQSELTSLNASLAAAQAAVAREQQIWTETGNEHAHQRMLIEQGEADFIVGQISKVTKEANAASRERTALLEKEAADAARLHLQETIGTARETIGDADVTARAHIQQIEHDGLLLFQQKHTLIEQIIAVQRTQIDDALRAAEEEASANLALAKTVEQRIAAEHQLDQVQKLRAAEMKRIKGEELAEDNRVSQQMETNALKVGSVISTSFSSAFDKMLTTHTNFAAVMTNFWNNMVIGFARMGIQILADWIKVIAARVVAWIAGEQIQTAAAQSGALQRNGIGIAETLKSIGRAAATAAAHAFKWVMEVVPFPANVILAPLTAAGAFASVLAFGALASAAGGAVLDKDTLVQAHAREMILPASISTGLQSVIAGGSVGPQGSALSSSAAVRGSTFHISPKITVHQTGDSSGRMSTEEISAAVSLGIRRGMINLT